MKTLKCIAIASVLLSASFTGSAHANDWGNCGSKKLKWSVPILILRAHYGGFPQGSGWGLILQDAVDSWNDTPVQFAHAVSWNEVLVGSGNGQNEIYWTQNGSAPAWCDLWYYESSCHISEADIVVRAANHNYTNSYLKTNTTAYGGSGRPLFGTLIHEMGHAMGAGHTADRYSIMGQEWNHIHVNGAVAENYPGEDCVSAAMGVYGKTSGSFEDVAMAHWRRTGASGEYATHARTRLLSSGGSELSKAATSPEPAYRVDRGQQVRMEMSYENLGKNTKTVKIGYYLSSNDYISTYDTLIGTGQVTVSPGGVYTTSNTYLTIPNSVSYGGTYWLGAVIDHDKQLTEADEYNNAAYTEIRINTPPVDLQAYALQGPPVQYKVWQGKKVSVQRKIYSIGGPLVGSFQYEIRLSSNNIITTSDKLVATINSSALGTDQVQVTVPSLSPGTYYWGMIVKPEPGETVTSNNKVAGGQVVVIARPDLKAKAIKGPKKVTVGQTVSVKIKVDPSTMVENYTYEIRLSTNKVIDSSDHLVKIGSSSLSSKQTISVTVPALPKGKYYWGLIVKPVDGEKQAGNNYLKGNRVKLK